ncbi:MAG: hypothetical protein KDB21_07770 [Acidimicrobiales bacterium]|nr:hypothetical protein [Acidimicrobiales bacterium]
MDPARVLALCQEHAEAEAVEDMDRVLATLVPNPRFEFFPLRRAVGGWDNIETFYRTQYPVFATKVLGYEVLREWTNESAALQEYVIDLAEDDGSTGRYFVMSMMPVDEAAGLLSGERLYCDDGFVRALLGPLFELLEPIE